VLNVQPDIAQNDYKYSMNSCFESYFLNLFTNLQAARLNTKQRYISENPKLHA